MNRIAEEIGIELPWFQAGMAGGVTTVELVTSVSEAGGLGQLGAGYMNVESLREAIDAIKKQTSKPFGVNLFVPEACSWKKEEETKASLALQPARLALGLEAEEGIHVTDAYDELLAVVLEKKVPVVSFTFGKPSADTVEVLQENGSYVIGTATTVEEAILNEAVNVDAVVAQGSEAGGHRGTFASDFQQALIGTMSLVPQVVDAVRVPVIAAGGIMDGRAIVAAEALGAEGVQLGTQFLMCKESGANLLHKLAISQAPETATVLTAKFSGKPARGLANRFTEEFQEVPTLPYPAQNELTKPIRAQAAKQQDASYMSLWAGQSPRLAKEQSVTQLMSALKSESLAGKQRLVID
ncbi:NAD(P)H-dependent flavin oxidoreductase [Shouchella shacheensis]|uniref:NAD(P)H-dependent flavin oxidoreductase n=1 Tax=Shouchella shacheensis TaxID=1649580 RepID=UPI00073FC442|nr:nitronate monooxygenase [Shouchella shacheensis]